MCTRLVGELQPGDDASAQPAAGASPQGMSIGTSQWDLEESRKTCSNRSRAKQCALLQPQLLLLLCQVCEPASSAAQRAFAEQQNFYLSSFASLLVVWHCETCCHVCTVHVCSSRKICHPSNIMAAVSLTDGSCCQSLNMNQPDIDKQRLRFTCKSSSEYQGCPVAGSVGSTAGRRQQPQQGLAKTQAVDCQLCKTLSKSLQCQHQDTSSSRHTKPAL